jgi:hypothetical protein
MRTARTCLCLAALLLSALPGANAQRKRTARPVKLSGGPLLLFTTQTKAAGDTLHAVDPQVSVRPQLVSETAYGFHDFHRLGRGEILLSSLHNLHRLDLRKGTVRPLAPGRRLELLIASGSSFFVLERLNEPDGTYEARPRLKLFAFRPGRSKELVPLEETPFESVLEVTPDRLWLIGGKPPALWELTRDGKQRRKVFVFDRDALPYRFTHEFSPNGKLLAVGVATRAFYTQDLLVIHLATGRQIYDLRNIPLALSSISSAFPRLFFTWLDGERLRYSESRLTATEPFAEGYFRWVEVNVLTRQRLGEEKYTDRLGLQHSKPRADGHTFQFPGNRPGRLRVGLFDRDGDTLYYRGDRRPAVEGLKDVAGWRVWRLQVAPDGRWAALQMISGIPARRSRLYLVDGREKRAYTVSEQFADSLTWLPAR